MLGEQAKYRNGYMVTDVYIDQAGGRGNDIKGYLIHRAENRAWQFLSLVDMMKRYEELFDANGYPQATHKIRKMGGEGDVLKKPEAGLLKAEVDADELKDKTPTFVVTVQYRQNASWQGTVKWLEGEKEARFESALEFIKLVDSLAQKEGETGWK